MMLKVILQTPFYVWPLLGLLLWGGWKARKTSFVPLQVLAIVPLIFSAWSCWILFSHYGLTPGSALCWIGSILLGIWIGIRTLARFSLQFNKEKKLVQLPGSWIPLLLSMSMFSVRYFLGMSYAMHPEWIVSRVLFPLELMATVICGCFLGRILLCVKRYRAA